jgi:hypothetical protein
LSARFAAGAFFFALGLAACANLPAIPEATCGNGVLDPGEDCDTFAPDATARCRAEGSVGECHLDCAPRDDGPRGACPTDWGCSSDGLCRRPTGAFDPLVSSGASRGSLLMSGDFDGDARGDLVTLEPPDAVGTTRLQFLYFDQRAQVADSRAFPKPLFSPVVQDVSADGRTDVVFSDSRINLLRGQSDRSLVPDTFGAYRFPAHRVRMFAVSSEEVGDNAPLVAVSTLNDVPGFYAISSRYHLDPLGSVPVELERLAGEPAVGNVLEDPEDSPCDELAFAVAGATEFSLVDFCARSDKGALFWRAQARERVIRLDPPLAIEGSLTIADFDGDHHLDVLLRAGGRLMVARGDGAGLAAPSVVDFSGFDGLDLPAEVSPTLLATADFSGDGAPDFVFDYGVYTSRRWANGATTYALAFGNSGEPWTRALIGDFNRDGHLDVVAASARRMNIDFLNGQSGPYLAASSIMTSGPVASMVMGDLDGDLVNDLVFAEKPVTDDRAGVIRAAFGNSAGPPATPVAIASVQNIEQLCMFDESGFGNLVVSSLAQPENNGVLTLLAGSPDRQPLAPYRLTSFTEDGSIADNVALSIAAGAFTKPENHDLLAFSGYPTAEGILTWSLWLVPEIDRGTHLPVELDVKLEPRLLPAAGASLFEVHAASADLDRDGLSDGVFVTTADSGTRCGVLSLRELGSTSVRSKTIFLDEPCPRSAPALSDLDGDGAPDLALLVGALDASERRIEVLWNDGSGDFAPSRASQATISGDMPQQFAFLPSSLGRRNGLAYVTANQVYTVSRARSAQAFDAPERVGDVLFGSGLAVADFNDDGVFDLAATGAGDITLFRAALEEQ